MWVKFCLFSLQYVQHTVEIESSGPQPEKNLAVRKGQTKTLGFFVRLNTHTDLESNSLYPVLLLRFVLSSSTIQSFPLAVMEKQLFYQLISYSSVNILILFAFAAKQLWRSNLTSYILSFR